MCAGCLPCCLLTARGVPVHLDVAPLPEGACEVPLSIPFPELHVILPFFRKSFECQLAPSPTLYLDCLSL